jgi:hypothetical protein
MWYKIGHKEGDFLEKTGIQQKLDYLEEKLPLLNNEGKEYLENISRQLLHIQYPKTEAGQPTDKKIRETEENQDV